jgi:hypothetical protein
MTLMVFLGVVVSLLILRLIPNLLQRLVLAIPHHHLMAIMHGRRIGIALPRKSAAAFSEAAMAMSVAPAGGRLKLVLVSSSLLVLAVLVSTAFWTWHSTGLMLLLR